MKKTGNSTKICSNSNCIHGGIEQSITNFSKNKTRSDGLNYWCKDCERKYRQEHKDKIHKNMKKYFEDHHNDLLAYQKQHNKDFVLYDTYARQLEPIHECRRDPDNNKLLQVRCFYNQCKEWFNPTVLQVKSRIAALKTSSKTENNFYCSDQCKESCSVFRSRSDGQKDKNILLRQLMRLNILQSELSDMVLEKSKHTCVKCGRSKQTNPDLIFEAHHIISPFIDPMIASDISNLICLCNECHEKIHKLSLGCKPLEIFNFRIDFEILLKMMNISIEEFNNRIF